MTNKKFFLTKQGVKMKFKVVKSDIKGTVEIPGSKSHTIRAFFFAALADGVSYIRKPLISNDTVSARHVCELLGAVVHDTEDGFKVKGFAGKPVIADDVLDVGNSGTTLRIALSTAALVDGYSVFTGDRQIRKRPLKPLIEALNNLGCSVVSTRDNGMTPVIVKGRAKGGFTLLDGLSSQFLTSILMNAPLFENETEIEMTRLNEVPYVDITLWWLDKLGIKYENHDYHLFKVPGKQSYTFFDSVVPADFSSATFFAVLAAISKSEITLCNLDKNDPQGDKEVFTILADMGAEVIYHENGDIIVRGSDLKGIEIDMNSIPDALPALAVAATFAEGETKLYNVEQARYKETDRITVMKEELKKMGADIEEFTDGLIIKKSKLTGTEVKGHDDHRIVMALSVAGLVSEGETVIDTAESSKVTFPNFAELIRKVGGSIEEL